MRYIAKIRTTSPPMFAPTMIHIRDLERDSVGLTVVVTVGAEVEAEIVVAVVALVEIV